MKSGLQWARHLEGQLKMKSDWTVDTQPLGEGSGRQRSSSRPVCLPGKVSLHAGSSVALFMPVSFLFLLAEASASAHELKGQTNSAGWEMEAGLGEEGMAHHLVPQMPDSFPRLSWHAESLLFICLKSAAHQSTSLKTEKGKDCTAGDEGARMISVSLHSDLTSSRQQRLCSPHSLNKHPQLVPTVPTAQSQSHILPAELATVYSEGKPIGHPHTAGSGRRREQGAT
ncbi:hypothetical protein HDK90DRAFT_21601 [Phyllosticta capitalensis]|uniref:Uncharacterized protein n=1 Tax=Phyllosticta capitalensis TaxID=121624 RepID=A0ABR1Z342_9PEZI